MDEKKEELKGPVSPPVSTFEQKDADRKKKQKPLVILGTIAAIVLIVVAGYLFYNKLNTKETKVIASKGATETVKKAIASIQTGPGQVVIARLKIDEAVLDDGVPGPVTAEGLLKGANYYDENTNVPGKGNVVLFGHSAVTSEHTAPFGAIGDGELKVGDMITLIDAANKKFTYVVEEITEIASNDFSYVRPRGNDEPAVLTIITCIGPYYPKDMRLAVRAKLQ